MKLVLLTLCIIIVAACGATQLPKPPAILVEHVSPAQQATDRIKSALDDQAKALKDGDKLAQLKAEKDGLRALLDRKKAEMDDLEKSITQKDKEIRTERIDQAQNRAYTIAGICGVMGAILLAASFFLSIPLVAKLCRVGSGVFFCMAVLCMAFAWLVPYIWPIVLGLAALATAAAIWQWRSDHRALGQVIKAVEPIKEKTAGAGEYLRDNLTKDVQTRVNSLRDAFKLR